MKKLLVICLVMALLCTMCVPAFAENGGFVSSPSRNQAPVITVFDPMSDGCHAQAVVTAYADRENLSAEAKALLERAYSEILGTDDLTTLSAALAAFAREKGIDGKNLAASDLFDISPVGCDEHDGHIGFNIEFKADTLKNFVALMHLTKDGVWELVADAKVGDDGESLSFSVSELSPFAILVNTNPGGSIVTTDETGETTEPSDDTKDDEDDNLIGIIVGVVVAAAAVAGIIIGVVVYYKKRKKSEDD